MAYIERLQVDAEGFLAGIDIHFSPGLNVIVGARGTGKTSIIELVRYALGASAFTKSAADRGKQQAQAILGGGAVTVTVRDGDSVFQAHRSGSMDSPSFEKVGVSCTVLGQNEIEAVGAQKSGRLHLIDRFREGGHASNPFVESVTASVASSTQAILDLLREIASLKDITAPASSLMSELGLARQQQLDLLVNSEASEADQQELAKLQASAQVIGIRSELIAQQEQEAVGTTWLIQQARSDLGEDASWPAGAGKDVFESVRAHRGMVAEALASASAAAADWEHAVRQQKATNNDLRVRVDQKSRELRQSLELLQAGASQAARTVADLEERIGQLAATNSRLAKRNEHLATIVAQRDEALNQLENVKQVIFEERQAIVARLNEQVGPGVRVEISKSAGTEEYGAAIVGALRGSGLHYNALAPLIADAVAPYELVRWVESQDAAALAGVVNLTTERAAVILSALRGSTPGLISVNVPDEVELFLLDGKDYKSTDRLSLGQRCTVVLPLLLGHTGDPLLLDQPEDHLDNAFIAETLVAALLRRQPEVQYIFASHNANIPVIGAADTVIVMASDGENGSVTGAGGLDDQSIVEAIERIMEGGVEAFEKRAAFYASQEAQ